MKKVIFSMALLTFFCGLNAPLHAAANAAGRKIMVWAMGAEGKLIREMADEFSRRNPGVEVQTQAVPWTGAHEKLVTSVIGGMPPDVSQMGTTWMPEFHAMGALQELDGFIKDSSFSAGQFYPASLQSNSFSGRAYGVPWYVDTRVAYYRKDIFEKAGYGSFPLDWTSFLKASAAVQAYKKKSGTGGYAVSLPTNDWQILLMFFWQAGGTFFPPGGAPLTTAPLEKALAYSKKFFDEGLAPLATGSDTDLLNAFASGYFPAFISGPSMISELERGKPEISGKWATAPLPKGERMSSFMGGCNLVIFKNSREKELAWKFLEFMSTAQAQSRWHSVSGALPANRLAWAAAELSANRQLDAFRIQLEHTQSPPPIPEWETVADLISGVQERVMHGKITPAQAAAMLSSQIEKVVKKTEVHQSAWLKIGALGLIFLLPLCAAWAYLGSGPPVKPHKIAASACVFLLPAMTVLLVFLFIPIIGSFAASLTNWNIYSINDWNKVALTGFANYATLSRDSIFWISLKNTIIFAALGVPLNITLALLMALAINREFLKFKTFFRIGFFIPVITTMVAVALIWRWLYNPEFGLLNSALSWLGASPRQWLADPRLALPALIAMAVWKGFGYNMIIFVAALQAIPESLYESIEIDGANSLQKFRYITFPMLGKTLFFVTLITTIGYLQFFAEPYVMTGGGPLNATMSVVLYMYQQGFKFYNLGYASSMAYALFGLIFMFTWLQRKFQARWEDAL